MSLERILEDSLEEINGEDRIRDVNGHVSGVIDDPDDVEIEVVRGAVVAIENGVRYEIESDLDDDVELESDGVENDEIPDLPEPTPPEDAPKYVAEGLEKQDPVTLRNLSRYAEELANYKRQEIERELEDAADVDEDEVPEEWDTDEWEETLEDADAPSGAGITTKTIDGRGYYYYQWREGDKIKSEYLAPVSPSSGDG